MFILLFILFYYTFLYLSKLCVIVAVYVKELGFFRGFLLFFSFSFFYMFIKLRRLFLFLQSFLEFGSGNRIRLAFLRVWYKARIHNRALEGRSFNTWYKSLYKPFFVSYLPRSLYAELRSLFMMSADMIVPAENRHRRVSLKVLTAIAQRLVSTVFLNNLIRRYKLGHKRLLDTRASLLSKQTIIYFSSIRYRAQLHLVYKFFIDGNKALKKLLLGLSGVRLVFSFPFKVVVFSRLVSVSEIIVGHLRWSSAPAFIADLVLPFVVRKTSSTNIFNYVGFFICMVIFAVVKFFFFSRFIFFTLLLFSVFVM